MRNYLSKVISQAINQVIGNKLDRIEQKLDVAINQGNKIMIDTSRILAEVTRERTESAGLRTLLEGLVASVKTISQQLADAIANNDPAAMAKVQADLDQAATDLSTDNDAAEAAIKANTPAAPTP